MGNSASGQNRAWARRGLKVQNWILAYLTAAALAWIVTPIVAALGRAAGLLDRCGVRKIHTSPTPRIGGVAILLATGLSFAFSLILSSSLRGACDTKVIALLAGAAFMGLVGLADDVRGLRAETKLAWQIIAAVMMCALGARIDSIGINGLFRQDLGIAAWPVTVAWIVGVTNAVNLIDGLDGLAAGISATACFALAVLAASAGLLPLAIIMVALAGGLTGFLRYNFHPASVFMGDSGSMSIGFMLASGAVVCTKGSPAILGGFCLVLGVPVLDMLCSIVRRILRRRSIFAADRSHIHHRLVDSGMGQRRSVIAIVLVTVFAGSAGVAAELTNGFLSACLLLGGALLVLVVFRRAGAVRLRESLRNLADYLSLKRQIRRERTSYEKSELVLSRAASTGAWWKGLCQAGQKLGFRQITIRTGAGQGLEEMLWQSNKKANAQSDQTIRLQKTLPFGSSVSHVHVEACLAVGGSLESAGRRASLFGRLLESCPMPSPSAGSLAA